MIHDAWVLICEISLWGWVIAAAALILKACPSRDDFRKGPAVVWGGFLILFYAIWIVGMINV